MNVSSVKNLNGETFSAVQDTFLTDIVSSNSANWNEISAYQANSASYLNESAFGYDANDKISGYNGSAFAGGSDIPEGVMVESGLEYNAANEISGYNGSAIAQYGAEKQWLVHDDTLVHASNSAQYALGVNISAIAQLLGVDETVLWTGTASKNDVMQLSEPFSGFHYLEVYGSIVQDNGTHNMLPACKVCIDDVVLPASFNIAGWGWWGNISNYKIGMNIGTYADSYSAIQHAGGVFEGYWDNAWHANENNNLKINRIIGIGRKA
jgi:hypothetical protein